MHPRKPDEYRSTFYQAIREEGLDNFHIQILELCEPEQLNGKEAYWIKELDTFNTGYNNDYGGALPCDTKAHHLTDHGMAKLSIGDVKMCRIAYQNGEHAKDIYDKYFHDKISYAGFHRMWIGENWKEVMPEVFQVKQHSRRKATVEMIYDIRQRFGSGETCHAIAKDYAGQLSYASIYDIAHKKRFADVN